MSSKSFAFALEQSQLPPQEQLTLIVIADCCAEHFGFEEAVKVVCKYTSLNAGEVRLAIKHLHDALLVVRIDAAKGLYRVAVSS